MPEQNKKYYTLNGLDCPSCAEKILNNLKKFPELTNAELNFLSKKLTVEFKSPKDIINHEKKIQKMIKSLEPGVKMRDYNSLFRSHSSSSDKKVGKNIHNSLVRFILVAIFFIIGTIVESQNISNLLTHSIFILGYLIIGYDVIIKAFKNIIRGNLFDENFLMTIATVGAIIINQYHEAFAVMLFYQVGETLQEASVNKSRKAITELMNIRPDYANVKRTGGIVKTEPEKVSVGEIIQIKPGEKIPLDGIITMGQSELDTSPLTGESEPRSVIKGNEVLSGMINLSGVIEIKVIKSFGQSTVSKILELVENAGAKKSKTEKFITKFSKVYTPVVVIIALIIGGLVPFIMGFDYREWIYKGLVFLIISCPCALVISVPLSYFSGIGKASKSGILVKGSNYLEYLSNVKTVVFDKTGTLTKGKFIVKDIITDVDKTDLLQTAAYAEYYSPHPIATAIREAYGKDIDEIKLDSYSETAGEGISVKFNNNLILAGNSTLMKRYNISYPDIDETLIHIAENGIYQGTITLSDEIKSTSISAIKELKKRGVNKIVILTGDNRKKAEVVADELGINEVFSELLPNDKYEQLEILQNELTRNEKIIFIGDGINDAPVLTLADVGIAMGGLGSDIAIEAADVVIMNDEPIKVVEAIDIAVKTINIAKQNIILAVGIKFVIQLLGVLGIVGMWAAVCADVGVTFLAVVNSMRILTASRRRQNSPFLKRWVSTK